ncbi:beta-lactamase family protein [Roseomonas sp. NAR14]|uniref:Beta-lactamase family protein n=1 Tax=Roseomonas acroporae TaxID=2937791 RepID=A0A9X1YI87_9PROT|nr:serine hydrolase domain-containing protein [Roseomonas acroporae]MCK8786676.1 beta-lactamase family protein [Roseomonas acroporae]
MQRRRMLRGGTLAASLLVPVAGGRGQAPGQSAGQPPAPAPPAGLPDGAEPLDPILQPFLASHGLPALAAAVVRAGRIVAAGAVGTRRAGAEIPVTLDDRFHIGSDTKAMTALLAAIEVEAGRLRWDGTVAESFPEMAAGMAAGLGAVTLAQLLSHSSGLPADDAAFIELIGRSFTVDGYLNLDELRLWLVREWSGRPLASAPGTRFAYANMNYVIAGAMIERAAGRTWEELIVERVFGPLDLRTAGLGPQSSMGRVDAPLGHAVRPDGTLKPMLAGPDGDGPAIIGPAGVVHLSVLDFARWAGWNAGEGRRGPALVRPETLRLLHTRRIDMPPRPGAAPGTPDGGGAYALGWGWGRFAFSPDLFLTHNGSNTMNLAMIALRPERDFGMVLVTNLGDTRADAALRAAAAALYGRFGAG